MVAAGATACQSCDTGTYTPNSNGAFTSCSSCHANAAMTSSPTILASNELLQDGCHCKQGYFGDGVSSCEPCRDNYESLYGQTCPCKDGFFRWYDETFSQYTASCLPCPANSRASFDSKQSKFNGDYPLWYEHTEDGNSGSSYYSDWREFSVSGCRCNAGFYATANQDSTEADKGFVCAPCSVNSHSVAGSGKCKCDAGFYQDSMSMSMEVTNCIQCPSNAYSKPGSTSREDCWCPAGQYMDYWSGCIQCDEYRISNCYYYSSYDGCYGVTASPKDADMMDAGTAGTCRVCPRNANFKPGTSTECQCNDGFHKIEDESLTCEPCPSNSRTQPSVDDFGMEMIDRAPSCQCNEGYTKQGQGTSWSCAACEAGKFKDSSGLAECEDCGVGNYSAASGIHDCSGCLCH